MASEYNILVVDDHEDLRLDLRDILKLEGYAVWTAANGKDALQVFHKREVDMVISDYEMPNMNGYTLLRFLRTQQRTARLPFILMSGGNPPSIEGDENFCFLKKPIIIEKLISRIKLIQSRPQNDSQRAAD